MPLLLQGEGPGDDEIDGVRVQGQAGLARLTALHCAVMHGLLTDLGIIGAIETQVTGAAAIDVGDGVLVEFASAVEAPGKVKTPPGFRPPARMVSPTISAARTSSAATRWRWRRAAACSTPDRLCTWIRLQLVRKRAEKSISRHQLRII